jgi:hypothetical protein
MSLKSECRFSEKIMLNQNASAMIKSIWKDFVKAGEAADARAGLQ